MKRLILASFALALLCISPVFADDKADEDAQWYVRMVKRYMRDPDSFVAENLYMSDGYINRIYCFKYRSRNGFGGMNREILVSMKDGTSFKTVAAWNKHCKGLPEYDLSRIKY